MIVSNSQLAIVNSVTTLEKRVGWSGEFGDEVDEPSSNKDLVAFGAQETITNLMPYAKEREGVWRVNDKVRQHVENIHFLNSKSNQLAKAIHDLEAKLGSYRSTTATLDNGSGVFQVGFERMTESELETIKQILVQENTAAGVFRCFMSLPRSLNFPVTKRVFGIVATLASVENDILSRIFSEYLGLEHMLAIVCPTDECVKALEAYDAKGNINHAYGLHGLGHALGTLTLDHFSGCRAFEGGFVLNDPQKKLAIIKPRLPNGETPNGFIDFAVNMIHLDHRHLSFVTAGGHGLRETLFYTLFSQVQVYKTRNDMMNALPYIHDGALALDGGMVKKGGMFFFGDRINVEVKFPIIFGQSEVPAPIVEAEEELRKLHWQKFKVDVEVKTEIHLMEDEQRKSRANHEKLV
ncbi:hypothetical protein RIF29_16491 [Crotalaria pallida]|uniref:Uncharacterized protein n=1 Tax=Crotalaria pallida TaxID=3830 RepID=A0AAN9FGM9_CROPI